MPLALPNGYFDTGVAGSISMAGEVRVRMGVQNPQVTVLAGQSGDDAQWFMDQPNVQGAMRQQAQLNDFKVSGWGWLGIFSGTYAYAAVLEWPGGTAKRLEGGSVATPPTVPYSGWYSFEEELVGLRLGRRRILDPSASPEPFPHFHQRHWIEQYRWFGDRNTRRVCSLGGHEVTLYLRSTGFWSTTQEGADFSFTFGGQTLGQLAFIGRAISTQRDAEFRNLTINGVTIDTSGIGGVSAGGMVGEGDGKAYVAQSTEFGSTAGFAAYAPTQVRLRVEPSLYYRGEGDREAAAAMVLDNWLTQGSGSPHQTEITTPFDQTYAIQNVSWTIPGAKAAPTTIGPWLLQSVEWNGTQQDHPELDQWLPIWCNPGNTAPSEWPAFWRPITVRFGDVLVADPSAWAQVDASTLRLSIKTTVATPEWRALLRRDVPGAGPFTPDAKDTTKHSGAYAWGWGSHGWLRFRGVRGGEEEGDSARRLRLYVEGVRLSITDLYIIAHREDGWNVAETPYAVEYALELDELDPLDPNRVTERLIDLMIPTVIHSGGTPGQRQFYHCRVDRVELRSADGKPLLVSDLELTLAAQGPVGLKSGYGQPIVPVPDEWTIRYDYSSLGASNGGSCPQVTSGDNFGKRPEDEADITFQTGGNLRYVNIRNVGPGLNSEEGGTHEVVDLQYTLAQLAGLLNGWEGFEVAYDTGADETANEDAYGTSLGTPMAQCWVPMVPSAEFQPGADYQPPCHWICAKVEIVQGYPFTIGTYHCVGTAIEALVEADTASGRAPAGTLIRAAGYPDSARACDGQGVVRVYPLPQGEDLIGLELA